MINYEPFFHALIVSLITKDKKESQFDEAEFRALISMLYRQAVHQVAIDTEQYLLSIPIDLYKETSIYPIVVPKDFLFLDVESIETNGYRFNGVIDHQAIHLPCCPRCDVPKAWFLQVAVAPRITSSLCEFDDDFVEKAFKAILLQIRHLLALQDVQKWAGLGKADWTLIQYKKAVAALKRGKLKIVLKQGSLTHDSTPATPSAGCNCS